MTKKPRRRECAYHEAGHAIMATLCGERVVRAVLRLDEETKTGGFCTYTKPKDRSVRVMCALAGHIAEELGTGRRRWLFGVVNGELSLIDDSDIAGAFREFKGSPIVHELVRCCWRQSKRALKLFDLEIRTIAAKLLRSGSISGQMVRRVVKVKQRELLRERKRVHNA